MVKFEKTVLPNGLPVIVNYDPSTPLVAMNILYKVGARNEDENKTGFAHLFEHLMFGGSVNIPSYDEPLQRAGGENNAFTNSDFTNYYLTIPAQNIETAFWLESDRMLSLAFSENSLEVQRNVVMEEFKQRYLNQPYGDVWLNLRPLAYKVHPYKWATIGKDLSHIEQATMADVKAFFRQWYCPNNAILTLSGNITVKKAVELANRWFGEIPKQHISEKIINAEPAQHEKRFLQLEKNIPADAIYKTFHACNRFDKDFYATELMVDILCGSNSSILYHSLVKEQKLFNTINVYFTGDIDNGLIVIEGKVNESVDIQTADRAINNLLNKVINQGVSEMELNIVKQKTESALQFSEMNIGNRALNLAYFEMIGNVEIINHQMENYNRVTVDDIQRIAAEVMREQNESVMYYCKKGGAA
ncbi:MAG TPA: pitrilysin family protein [Bacteroidia bacterium]|jgi:zinc protease|nr:pitrilysin family protein [Bacteroidia bacterium]HMU19695.1 pitrilysin family protein [Bacteroidia bacterium]